MRRVFVLLVVLITSILVVEANSYIKSDKYLPPWRYGEMPPFDSNVFYIKVYQGEGLTVTEARENAILGLIAEIARSKGVTISGKQIAEIKAENIQGFYKEEEKTKSIFEIKTEGFDVSFQLLDEYWEEKQTSSSTNFVWWGLFEVAYDQVVEKFDKIQYTTDYGLSTIIKSFIVPGWGQFDKHQTIKGATIFGVESLFLGIGMVAENLRIDNLSKMNNTRIVANKRAYMENANTCENARNIALASASVVYLYNIIDAIVSKGAKKYIKDNSISLNPILDNKNIGISFALYY